MLHACVLGLVLLLPVALDARDHQEPSAIPPHPDPVIARLLEHFDDRPRPLIVVADRDQFERGVWNRVRNLVAFRLHRPQPDGRTVVDAPIYLVRDSRLFQDATAALRNRATVKEYVWCRLAAVIAHEAAHTAPETERAALLSEAEQLRRCLLKGHLHSSDGWSAGAYLMKVRARLRNPREHY
jgi:hypothetical protein